MRIRTVPITVREPFKVKFHYRFPPPTVTHQAKTIVRRGRKIGLSDTPRLKAAIKAYMTVLPANPGKTVMSGPISAVIRFVFLREPSWHQSAPDLDNMAKTFIDAVVALGWLADDREISRLVLMKYFGPQPGVWASFSTIKGPSPASPENYPAAVVVPADETDSERWDGLS